MDRPKGSHEEVKLHQAITQNACRVEMGLAQRMQRYHQMGMGYRYPEMVRSHPPTSESQEGKALPDAKVMSANQTWTSAAAVHIDMAKVIWYR